MSAEGYVLSKNGFVTLKTKGMRAVGINSKPKKVKDFIFQKKAEMAELFFRFEGWEVIYAKEFKKAVNFYKGARIEAVIKNGEYKFGVYHILFKPL